jgi:hypothetical protein
MILCTGCKYYRSAFGGLCKVNKGRVQEVVQNKYDGKTRKYYGFLPYITDMRSEGGQCGPEAILRKPGLWEKIKKWDW